MRHRLPNGHCAAVLAAGMALLAAGELPARGQWLLSEDFTGPAFPPQDWSVTNAVGGPVAWDSTTAVGEGNWTGGTGPAAMADSLGQPFAAYDTALLTPVIALPAEADEVELRFLTALEPWSGDETADVDVRDGDAWVNLLSWHHLLDPVEGLVTVSLSAWRGRSVQVRFRYHNADAEAWDVFWQLDDVEVVALPIPGDADEDRDVDYRDYVALKRSFGTLAGADRADGDFDADGDVDYFDYAALREHFGRALGGTGVATAPPAAVPEPAGLALLAGGAAALIGRRRRRRA